MHSPDPIFTLLDQDRRHDGFLKLDRYQVRQRRFDGTDTPPLVREVVSSAECVAVLLYDPGRDAVVLIEQARLPSALMGVGAVQVEVVAGRIEPGDTPVASVHREVAEETGCSILGEPEAISVALTSPGYSTERLHFYYARVDAGTAEGYHGLAAEHEDIRVLVVPYGRFVEWQADGTIGNLFTLYLGQWLAANRERLRAAG